MRIILIRHGQPHIALNPRTGHAGFSAYIDEYETAELSPSSVPPDELRDLVKELTHVFSSDRPRSRQSAGRLLPHAELTVDPLFAEAPLASPRLPYLQMEVPKWAVVSRILWHAGFHPGIENPGAARARASKAADFLIARARTTGSAALVAHGYFNWMIGRQLLKRGFRRTGTHQARYWNTVIYEDENDRDES
ncbi:MAG TPA: histidine phosphatase family protein [Rhizomicrobium sp.]|nr:histidine phosphatase family protein [Rhizomicrobium sp.]